jgi:spermidine synthase
LLDKALRILNGWRLEAVAFVVGVVVLAFELTASRIVAPYMGTTIYTWTSIIGIILAALAVGYGAGGAWADKRQNSNDVVLLLLAAAVVMVIMGLVKDWVLASLTSLGWPLQLQGLSASLFLFALPTVLMGAVSPYLARLNITEVGSSGKKLSRINAAGTLGSLVGTFLTGYVLFGLIGTRNLLVLLAFCLVATTLLMEPKKQLWGRVLVAASILIISPFASKPLLPGYVRSIDTAYSRIVIRDILYQGRPVRALQTDSDGLQSGVYLDHKPGLAFDYIRGFVYASELQPHAKDYLIIGGGAFTFPEYLAMNAPSARVDTVEIDSKLTTISQRYFNFQQPANLHIITADGRQYLNTSHSRYDMLFIDAFSSVVPPFQLTTKEAVARMHGVLQPGGIVVANVISGASGSSSQLIQAFASTYQTSFAHVAVYRINPSLAPSEEQNLLLIASEKPIGSSQLSRVARNNPEFAAITKAELSLPSKPGLVLTDDFAPVEQLAFR